MIERKAGKYHKRLAALKGIRQPFEERWKMISQYINPSRSRFHSSEIADAGSDEQMRLIINNTGTLASRTLASGIMSKLTNPSSAWFKFGLADTDKAAFKPVKQYLFTTESGLRRVFSRSNIYNALHSSYGDLGDYGTSCILLTESDKYMVRAQPFAIGQYYIGVNDELEVDTCYLEHTLTVSDLVIRYGKERVSRTVQNMYDKKMFDSPVDIIRAIEPNVLRDPKMKDAANLPFSDIIFEAKSDEDKLLREGGFHEFPVLTPRWDVIGNDAYGSLSPGIQALGDIKMLQEIDKITFEALEKQVNPPKVAPAALLGTRLDDFSGGTTFYDSEQGRPSFHSLYNVNYSTAEVVQHQQIVADRIAKSYYSHLFVSEVDSRMTAFEVAERANEKMLQLGPVANRLNPEQNKPMIDRSFAILSRRSANAHAGLGDLSDAIFPPPPEELKGEELDVEYIGPMAQAQKAAGLISLDRMFSTVANISPIFPGAADKINSDKAIDIYGDLAAVNPDAIRSDEEVLQMREARAKQAQEQAAMEQVTQVTGAAKDMSQMDTGGQNMLTEALGAMQD